MNKSAAASSPMAQRTLKKRVQKDCKSQNARKPAVNVFVCINKTRTLAKSMDMLTWQRGNFMGPCLWTKYFFKKYFQELHAQTQRILMKPTYILSCLPLPLSTASDFFLIHWVCLVFQYSNPADSICLSSRIHLAHVQYQVS